MINQPSYTADGTLVPLDLVIDLGASDTGVILSGAGSLTAGTLLGKVTLAGVTASSIATKGALTPDATTPRLAGCQLGAYTAVCITAASNAGTFEVFDPKGNSLGTHIVAGAAFANQIKFAIADGGVDFVVGDTFTITVAAGSGKYVKSLAASTDGSQYPAAILSEDTDATSADKTTVIYITGRFNSDAVTFGTGHTLASTKDDLRDKGIILQPATANR